jgi:hypothetical protein
MRKELIASRADVVREALDVAKVDAEFQNNLL